MAFFDKLKKVAEKLEDAATKAVATAVELTEQVKEKIEQDQQSAQKAEEERREAQRQAALEAEAKRRESEEAAKQQKRLDLRDRILNGEFSKWDLTHYLYLAVGTHDDEIKELERVATERRKAIFEEELKKHSEATNCDVGKGDCCWLENTFYCTCGDQVDCPRKTYIKPSQFGKLVSPEHLPYAKLLATLTDDAFNYYRCYDGTKMYVHDVLHRLFENIPEQAENLLHNEDLFYFFYNYGIGLENPVVDIMVSIHEQTGGKVAVPLYRLHEIAEEKEIDLRQFFFKNPSLYERSETDFYYTVRVLDTVNNPKKLSKYFEDISTISIGELFNPDGTIKSVGYGGPREGHYGDVIYNIVSMWGNPKEFCDLNADCGEQTDDDSYDDY